MLVVAALLFFLSPTASMLLWTPHVNVHASRHSIQIKLTAVVPVIAGTAMRNMMLNLMDKWILDEAISKPYETDETADAYACYASSSHRPIVGPCSSSL
jgi:hypothetical protein